MQYNRVSSLDDSRQFAHQFYQIHAMKTIYVSIDDTDNHESPGSGQLADNLVQELKRGRLIVHATSVSRHQLYVDDAIPYTSHNSSMCFTAITGSNNIDELIRFSSGFLSEQSARGSDPGLCVTVDTNGLDREALVTFGLEANTTILSQNDAYTLAKKVGIHLAALGGSGDGVIGALAGTGLRMQGSDGRFRGWLKAGVAGQVVTAGCLRLIDRIELVVDEGGYVLPDHRPVRISESKIKTIARNHQQVIPVKKCFDTADELWQTLSKKESKEI